MGHAVSMLSFPEKMDKKRIQAECDEWGDYNCDPYERGGHCGGLQAYINFTSRIFDSYDEAYDYLATTTGYYRQTAVRYKKYPESKPTKVLEDKRKKVNKYDHLLLELQKPHYKDVKQATVKCKCCGSSLATKYCGSSYNNNCPVCRTDLRPESILEKQRKYKSIIKETEKEIKEEVKKINKKNEAKAELYWMVCCEVHC